jgi:hypothetical protein
VHPSLLVTAPDVELPAMLPTAFPGALFATPEQVRAIIRVKPGPLVLLLDSAHASLVSGLIRTDVRAVAVVTPSAVPMMFRRPIVDSLERPLIATRVIASIKSAMGELRPVKI